MSRDGPASGQNTLHTYIHVYILVLSTVPDDCYKDGTYFPSTLYIIQTIFIRLRTAIVSDLICSTWTSLNNKQEEVRSWAVGGVIGLCSSYVGLYHFIMYIYNISI